MLFILLRKMFSNKWMILCLLLGSVLTVAMISSIPIYSDGVLQRMLTRDLENYQQSTNIFPGRYHMETSFYYYSDDEAARADAYKRFNRMIGKIPSRMGLPMLSQSKSVSAENFIGLPEVRREEEPKKRFFNMEALSDFKEHIKILHGKIFSNQKSGETYEVVVNEKAMKDLDLRLNEVYLVTSVVDEEKVIFKVKVTGVFTIKDPQDLYWFSWLSDYDDCFLMDYALFLKDFVNSETPYLTAANWDYVFDYHKIDLDNIKRVLDVYEAQSREFKQYASAMDLKLPCIPILEEYRQREKSLTLTLWVLQVPIILMLAFYIFMVSLLIINFDENEIAVLKSRGASGKQVFISYFLESLLLSVVTLVIGPPLGLFFCKILGSSNGFLEFVQRTALPVSLGMKPYIYSLWALVLFMVTMLIPAVIASRTSIVQYKQKTARKRKMSFWKKFGLDVILLAVAYYGLYSYKMRTLTLTMTGIRGTDLSIDPLLFLISTLFILGSGLLFLRLFPIIVRFIFWLGRKLWSPVLYASFVQVGRSRGQEQFLMLFIILALSLGIFNANAARTVNKNMEDRIRYDIGADITLMAQWDTNKPRAAIPGVGGPPGMAAGPADSGADKEPLRYIEPLFSQFTKLSGVETATKVFRRENITLQANGEWIYKVNLIAVTPDEFGKVAWFRNDLLPSHWYQYLNLLADSPTAFLVSKSLQKKYKLREGDPIALNWGDEAFLEGYIYAFVNYWPTYNPIPASNDSESADSDQSTDLVVGNLSYIRAKTSLEPYEVWIKKKPGATDIQVNDDIDKKNIKISRIDFANNQIVVKKNDPMLQGTNGALTMGFVITMIISGIGFLIYWILSIKKRILQFGILRAMGLSLKKIIGMLLCEQIMISGVAILVGINIGGITCDLFIPLLQMVYNAKELALPFRIVAYAGDYVKLYTIVAFMITAGFTVLGMLVSRININQAIKLGED